MTLSQRVDVIKVIEEFYVRSVKIITLEIKTFSALSAQNNGKIF